MFEKLTDPQRLRLQFLNRVERKLTHSTSLNPMTFDWEDIALDCQCQGMGPAEAVEFLVAEDWRARR